MTAHLTRRDVLAAFLGAPLAAACARRPPPRPPGELVGASDAFGHLLRDEPPPRPAAWRRERVAIVGGGVAGLAAAWRLLRGGLTEFRLYELEGAPGGTARAGDAYPWGAHYVPAPTRDNPALLLLLAEMGIVDGTDADGEPVIAEQHLVRDPEERVYYRGRWYEGLYLHAGASPEDERQLAAFLAEIQRWVDFRDGRGRRAFTLPTARASDDAEVTALDRDSFRDWAGRHGFTSPRLLWLLDYACRDDYGATLDETSAWAGVFYFASRATRSASDSRPLMTWPQGNGHLVAHLWRRAADRARLDAAACDVAPGDDGVDVTFRARGGDAFGVRAERVIFAAPQFIARRVIRGLPDDRSGFEYGAWMVANLHLRGRPGGRGFPLCWDNVLYDSPSLGYVVATHQRGPEQGPTVLTYYYPLVGAVARKTLLAAGQPEWADVALADLGRAHPDVGELVERVDVMRWGHAMIRPRPGFVWGARARGAPFRGVHFACSDLSGVALFEEAFDHGVRAAEEVLASLGRPGETVR